MHSFYGGEGGIRTLGTGKGTLVFETSQFNHSCTSPNSVVLILTDIQCIIHCMEDSTFTKIMNGSLPGQSIYSDDQCIVLMSIEPINPGHCLVIPRKQIDSIWDLDAALYSHLFDVAHIMADRIAKVYDYQRIGLLVEGFGVPHAHVHVFGYAKPMAQTMAYYLDHKHMITQDELSTEGAKLSA